MKKALSLLTGFALMASLLCQSVMAEESTGVIFEPDQAIVETGVGTVRGYIEDGIFTFKGIPYATAERFQEPQPITWEGIKPAVVYQGQAPQADQSTGNAETMMPHLFWPTVTDESLIQSINIWTPGTDDGKRAVLFWIHGGGFSSGSAYEQICFDGQFLSRRGDVVVVSINHRLNCLGFLDLSSFGEEYANSGNLGMMDIVAALQWVKDNIAAFGGDPDNVTVFGQSGGGRKILNLMGTPAAQGLFAKAIGESCGQQSIPQEIAKKVGEETVAMFGDSVDDIKDVPYRELVAAATAALAKVNEEEGTGYAWSPVAGGDWMPVDIWLQDDIGDASKDVPLLIGSNFAEVTTNAFAFMGGPDPIYKNSFTEEEVDAYLTDKYGDAKDAVVAAFQEAYPLKPIIDAGFVDVNTYRAWVKAVLPKKAAQEGTAPIYNYVFAYELPNMGGWLPFHCSELPFVWHNVDSEKLTVGTVPETYALSDLMSDAWISFAKTGDPNHEGMIEWPQWTLEDGATMIFDTECTIGHNHDDKLMEEIAKAAQ